MKVSLKALRVNAEMTQDEAAKAMNVTKKTIQNWENYETSMSASQLVQICELYHCGLNDVFLPSTLAKSEQETAV